jgi:thioester reductase-like protein
MTYFVTGATGFIGRHLVERLLEREGDIYVLVREGSRERLHRLVARWDAGDRIKPVVGDLGRPRLGLCDEDVAALTGDVDHIFHLAAMYDMTADESLNVEGTRHVVQLAAGLAGRLAGAAGGRWWGRRRPRLLTPLRIAGAPDRSRLGGCRRPEPRAHRR